MKKLTLVVALGLAATQAFAQTRPQTTAMTCRAAQALVNAQGAIVLGTGGDTFDRFVRDQSFCAPGQVPRVTFAPSADVGQCYVGNRCYDPPQETR